MSDLTDYIDQVEERNDKYGAIDVSMEIPKLVRICRVLVEAVIACAEAQKGNPMIHACAKAEEALQQAADIVGEKHD